MRKKAAFVTTLALCLLLFGGGTGQAESDRVQIERPRYVPGELLVKLKADIGSNQIGSLNRQFKTQTIRYFDLIDLFHLKLPAGQTVENTVQQLQQHPLVEFATPNNLYYLDLIPNDPSFNQMWALHNTGQEGGTPDADIDAPEAWEITTGSSDVVIAVIDSGVDLAHEDLAANIWTNPDEIPDNGLDDDNNGFVDDLHGWDFSSDDNDPAPAGGGCLGHGTHVAGTIGAVGNNNLGVTGINWTVKIMALKAFTPILGLFCAANEADLIAAIQYYTMMEVPISNNSWGGTSPNLATFLAIRASNSLFVAAAGNGGQDLIGDNNDLEPHYPSNYGLDNIIAVAATDRNDDRAGFSNFGFTSVDLGAPGIPILSTLPNNNYGNLFGTSMAAPHVAGVAGLLLAQDPTLTPNELKWRLLNGTDTVDLPVLTGGRLNAHQALQFGLSTPAVTVDLTPLGPTGVPRGGLFSFRINLTNHQAGPVDTTFKVYARFDNGFELPLFQSAGPLTANQVISDDLTRRMPWIFPPGTTLRLYGQVETAVSFDEDRVAYRVIPRTSGFDGPYTTYLPLVLAN